MKLGENRVVREDCYDGGIISFSSLKMFILFFVGILIMLQLTTVAEGTAVILPKDGVVPLNCVGLFAQDFCHIELRSWGYNDSALIRLGYARVNGRLVDNYERPDHNEQVRGFNIYVLRLSDCTTTESKHFDTWDIAASGSYDLAQYLGSLSPGTVVYGATCDDAKNALRSAAQDALLAIGVNVTSLAFRGKLTFVAEIGRPRLAAVRMAGPGGDNLFMDAFVMKRSEEPYVDQTTSNYITLDPSKDATTNAYWFPIAVSSLVLNAVAIIATTLVIIYAKKRTGQSLKLAETKSSATATAADVNIINSYEGLSRGQGEGYETPGSFYHQLPERANYQTPIPQYYNDNNNRTVAEVPDYLELTDD